MFSEAHRRIHRGIEHHLVPEDARLVRSTMNRARKRAEARTWKQLPASRGYALLTPFAALGTAFSYAAAFPYHAATLQFGKAGRDLKSSLQCVALAVATAAMAVFALLFGYACLKDWGTEKPVFRHNMDVMKRVANDFSNGITVHGERLEPLYGAKGAPSDQALFQLARTFDQTVDHFSVATLNYLQALQNGKGEEAMWEIFSQTAEEAATAAAAIIGLQERCPVECPELKALAAKAESFDEKYEGIMNRHDQYAKTKNVPSFNRINEYLSQIVPEHSTRAVKLAVGQIIKGRRNEHLGRMFDKSIVREALSDLFGPRIVGDVFKFYKMNERQCLSRDQLSALIVGIQANVTLDDIRYMQTKREELGALIEGLDGDLSDSHLFHLLERFRKPIRIPSTHKAELYNTQLEKDLGFLDRCRHVKDYAPIPSNPLPNADFKEFGYAEFMARSIVYKLFSSWKMNDAASFSEGVLFPVYDARRSNEPIIMQAHGSFSDKGLHAVNVLPANPIAHEKYGIMGATIFRGTQDVNAVQRDVDFWEKLSPRGWRNGPGRSSFAANQQALIDSIHRDLNQLFIRQGYSDGEKMPITWEFAGHSLGGTDAQRMMAAFAGQRNRHVHFQSINAWTFNAPRIERDQNNAFFEAAKNSPDVEFRIYHGRTDGDAAQYFGDVLLGHQDQPGNMPENVKATVVSFERMEKSRLKNHSLHQTSNYHKSGRPNSTWAAHVATNDPDFAGKRYGKIAEKRVEEDEEILVARFNQNRSRPSASLRSTDSESSEEDENRTS